LTWLSCAYDVDARDELRVVVRDHGLDVVVEALDLRLDVQVLVHELLEVVVLEQVQEVLVRFELLRLQVELLRPHHNNPLMFNSTSAQIAESMGFVSFYGISPWTNLLEDKRLKGSFDSTQRRKKSTCC